MLLSRSLCSFLFSFIVQPTHTESSPNKPQPEGGKISLWCRSQTSNPPVTILWEENGIPIPSDRIEVITSEGDFHGTKVQSTVILPAEKSKNEHVVTCTPELNGMLLENQSKHYMLNVTCKYLSQ